MDIVYCISFTDSDGVARTTDPQLINKPTPRPPTVLQPMARKPVAAAVKPSVPAHAPKAAPVRPTAPSTGAGNKPKSS